MKERKVSVTFLSSKNIYKDLAKIDKTDADYIHVDVMDGKFVPNRFKPFRKLVNASLTISKRLDVHLMVTKPEKWIHKYATLNTEYITIHVELKKNLAEYLKLIKSYGIKCGLSINPDTDINELDPYLDLVDLILVMSVEPGKGGQKFIDETYARILLIKKKLLDKNLRTKISVDGGLNDKTAEKVKMVDIIVSGSYIVLSDDFQKAIDTLR